jgi:DNA-directed RNA polymerase subunit RPC12/RpoP
LHPRRELAGKRVRCPDCGVAVRVPTAAQVAKAARRKPAAVGEYRVVEPGVTTVDEPACFLLLCPTCGARMHPSVELVGKRVRCPDCERPVLVTPPAAPVAVKARPKPGEYGVGGAPVDRPPVNVDLLRSRGTLEAHPLPPPPPRLWFYEGVLSFPWKQESIGRWLILSLFAIVTDAVTTYAVVVLPMFRQEFDRDAATALQAPFAVMLGGLLWSFTMFYAANCIYSVIRDTAAGSDEITDWGDGDLSDGIWRLAFLVAPLLAAGSLGFGVMFLGALVWPPGAIWLGLATGAMVAPIMVLSIMDNNSIVGLFSATVLRGVKIVWRGWLLFYIEAGLLIAAWSALTVVSTVLAELAPSTFLRASALILTVLVTAPLWAALVLILARLLGRLAWHAADVLDEVHRRELAEDAAAATDG